MSSGESDGFHVTKEYVEAYYKHYSKVEILAVLEHEQWVTWAKSILESEPISKERKERWEQYFVPYAELSEEVKEYDREWARKALELLKIFD